MPRRKREREIPIWKLDRDVFQAIRANREELYNHSIDRLREQLALHDAELDRSDSLHAARLEKRQDRLKQAIEYAFESMIALKSPVPAQEAWYEEELLKGNDPGILDEPPSEWMKKHFRN